MGIACWIDNSGTVYNDLSKLEDLHLKNIAFALSKGKGNVRLLKNNKVVIDGIYNECKRRGIFYNQYEEYLREQAHKIWLTGSPDEETVNEQYENLVSNLIKEVRDEFFNEALD